MAGKDSRRPKARHGKGGFADVANKIMPSLTNSGISDILKPIEEALQDVNALMAGQFTGCGPAVQELVAAFNGSGGKMLRPALVLLSGKCFGPVTDAHIRAAAVIQMLHNATLLHDDVIDEGQKRRGKPTINALWGNEAAVIFGDLVLSKALLLAVDMDSAAFATISDAMARVCAGELRQMLNRSNWQLTESDYIEIITEKSASLFSACCRVGAILSGVGDAEAETMARFGLDTGIAFQITDDILDIVADEKRTGKTTGSDFDDNKLTLPVIHLLATMQDNRKRQFIEKHLSANNRGEIRGMLDTSQSIDYARKRARQYTAQAVRRLDDIGDGDAKAALIETARFIGRRSL
jgi:octaprenyl-diphosphate synthase